MLKCWHAGMLRCCWHAEMLRCCWHADMLTCWQMQYHQRNKHTYIHTYTRRELVARRLQEMRDWSYIHIHIHIHTYTHTQIRSLKLWISREWVGQQVLPGAAERGLCSGNKHPVCFLGRHCTWSLEFMSLHAVSVHLCVYGLVFECVWCTAYRLWVVCTMVVFIKVVCCVSWKLCVVMKVVGEFLCLCVVCVTHS